MFLVPKILQFTADMRNSYITQNNNEDNYNVQSVYKVQENRLTVLNV